MVELIVIGGLAWAFYRYKAVNIAIRALLFTVSVLGLLVLLKVGFISTFIIAVLSIPIDFVSGVFGIFYHLLLG